MDKLSYLESFLTVLDFGSLTAAAKQRQISQPAISQQMKALETHYGTPLLQRSSQGVQPSRAGSIVARHALALIEQHQLMLAELRSLDTCAHGELRISMSQFLGQSPVGEAIHGLRRSHPNLSVVLKVEDRLVDVAREGYDLALRTGSIGNGGGIMRKIGRMSTMLIASTEYLDKLGRPVSPADLRRLAYIQYAEHRTHGFVTLRHAGKEVEAEFVTGMIVDTPTHLLNAVRDGYGFSRIPRMMGEALVRDHPVEEVLPNYPVESKGMYLVYPHRHALHQSARVVIQAIYEGLTELGGVTLLPHPDFELAA